MAMRILIGIIAFVVWGLISVQWYVCGVKGLCNDDEKEILNSTVKIEQENKESVDTVDVEEPTLVIFTIKETAIYFPFAKSKTEISKGQEDSLKIIVRELNDVDAVLLLNGNTDSIGSFENNNKLGEERADWIRELMISYGLSAEKIKVESKGERKPVDKNSTESGRQKNRRVDIIINDL